MRQQHIRMAKATSSLLGCTGQSIATSTGGTHLERCLQEWGPQYERRLE